jgi:hypothetical protein
MIIIVSYYSDANNAIRGAYALQPSRRRHRPRPFAHLLPPPSTPEKGRAIITLCNAVHPGHPPNTLQNLSKTTQSGAQVQSKTKRETCMLEFGSEGAPA